MFPKFRHSSSPGEILRCEFMEPKNLSPKNLANQIGMDLALVEGILDGSEKISKEIAGALARVFHNTPEFWMNLQSQIKIV